MLSFLKVLVASSLDSRFISPIAFQVGQDAEVLTERAPIPRLIDRIIIRPQNIGEPSSVERSDEIVRFPG